MKLTHREKILILILVVLLVLFGGWKFLLGPALAEKQRLETSVETLTFQKQQVDQTASEAESIQSDLANAYQEMDTETYFYRDLTTADVDRLLSAFAKERAVTITELDIPVPETASLNGYIPNIAPLFSAFREQRIKFDEQAARNYQNETNGLSAAESAETAITIPLYRCSLLVSGKTANVAAMVDDINHSGRSIYVSGFGDKPIQNIEGGVYSDILYVEIYFLED